MAKRKKEPTAWDMAKQVPAVVLEYAKVSMLFMNYCVMNIEVFGNASLRTI